MKKKILFVGAVSLLLVFAAACGKVVPGWTAKPAAEPGTVLFEDSFDPPTQGWGTMKREEGLIGFGYGGMVFTVDLPDTVLWSVNGDQWMDTRIEVDGILVDGSADDFLGVICRYQDDENFYAFLVSNDGYYGIIKYFDGRMAVLPENGLMQYTDVIRQGVALNHIQAVCQGDELRLSVNDSLLIEITDISFSSGRAGLIAGSHTDESVMVLFDNMAVYQP